MFRSTLVLGQCTRRTVHCSFHTLRTQVSSIIASTPTANRYSTVAKSHSDVNTPNPSLTGKTSSTENLMADKLSIIGWIRSIRRHKTRVFFDVSDGTSPFDLQVVASPNSVTDNLRVGSAVSVAGDLKRSPNPDNTHVLGELHAHSVRVLDNAALVTGNPLDGAHGVRAPRPDLGLLRSAVGLSWRHRLPELAAMLRLRAQLKQITREVMQEMEYLEVDTPILTTVDCEGTKETFTVQPSHHPDPIPGDRSTKSTVPLVTLSGSAQLHLEALALGMSKVYTLSPAFRAESSHTRHHLAEFHMLEVESVHLDTMDQLCAEIETLTRLLLDRFLNKVGDRNTTMIDDSDHSKSSVSVAHVMRDLTLVYSALSSDERWSRHPGPDESDQHQFVHEHLSFLESTILKPFVRVTFQEACDHLQRPTDTLCDLTKDEERRVLAWCGNHSPVLLTHFPCTLKPFYCQSVDGIHSEAVDLLVPGIGELVGGSVRETCTTKLQHRIAEAGLDPTNLDWYVDLRGLGGAPHGGFGMGFERLLQFVTGVYNIRDAIPFPRVPDKICL